MRLLLIVFLSATIGSLDAWSQSSQIKGHLADGDTRQPLANATVALLNIEDSTRAASSFTKENGTFILEDVRPGRYHLYITYLGYRPIFRVVEVNAVDNITALDTISMQRTGVTLGVVEILQTRSPMVISRDTVEFDAYYYRTRKNAVMEELLKKLPGVQIRPDGTIEVYGEIVEGILVDGKPFLGDDPKLAAITLPADMIDKIQLIDKRSEQVQFTGMDDGRSKKVINITVRDDKKERLLGRLSAGYGTDSRFAVSGNVNRFSDIEQISFLGSANNVNNPGFLEGNGQGAGKKGIAYNWNGGINYSRVLGKKLKFSSSYVIDRNDTESQESSARQNLLPDTTYYYDRQSNLKSRDINHRFSAHMEYRPDSLNLLNIAAGITNDVGSNSLDNNYESLNGQRQLVNKGTMNNTGSGNALNEYITVLYGRKFRQAGRVLSVIASTSYQGEEQEIYNMSHNLFIYPNGVVQADSINQYNEAGRKARSIQFSLSFIEPVFRGHFIELMYDYTHNYGWSGRSVYNYDDGKKAYDLRSDSLSNDFENVSTFQHATVRLYKKEEKYDYSIGVNVRISKMDNFDRSRYDHVQQQSKNFYPSTFFNYSFTNNRRIGFSYLGNIQPPVVSQLQPVPDNSNPLYIQQGNPDLKVAFTHNFSIRYDSHNAATTRAFSARVKASLIADKIINASWFDHLGRQVSQPLNVNGAYNIEGSLTSTFFNERRNSINTRTSILFSKDINYVNNVKGANKSLGLTQALGFNYVYRQLLDLSATASVSYSGVKYLGLSNNNTRYVSYALLVGSSLNLPIGFIAGINLDYQHNTGRAVGYNVDIAMLNASLSKTVFARKRGLIKLQCFDLLNRSRSISRLIGENYIEDTRTNVLRRFFMLSFSYFLSPFTEGE